MVVSTPTPRKRVVPQKPPAGAGIVDSTSTMTMTMSLSSMILQASELATVEADGNVDAAALGDMEVTLRGIASHHNTEGSNDDDVVQTPTKGVVAMGGQGTASCEMKLPSQRSPSSQFECDILNATHPELDIDSLQKQKSYPRALFDDDDSEESLENGNESESFASEDADAASTNNDDSKVKEDEEFSCFVHDILSPMDSAADFMFCQLQCAFPDVVKDANEIMTTELHHLMFPVEEEEREEAKEEEGGTLVVQSDDGGGDQGEGDNQGDDEEDMIVVFGPHLDEEEEGGVEQDEGGTDDEQDVDDIGGGEEIVVDERKDSLDVDVVLGRWVKMQDQFEKASYSPGEGFVLRKDVKMPELSEDEVLVRVDAAAISTRDCLERLRRDSNKDLKDEVWVPGHEIVGHVVRAGSGMDAKSLLDKRIASILPYGGGCSQYVCIHAKDAIAVHEKAGSNDVVALLSTYMTAYQCLESVVGTEPKEEEDAEGEEEDDDAEAEEDDSEAEAFSSNNLDDSEQKRSHLFGKNVLIIDSGSPVGLALVDLATNAGATVHTVSHLISTVNVIRWRGCIDLIVDVVGGSGNNPSFFKIMKTRGRLVRVNITSCEEKYVPLAGKIEAGKDTSYFGRVINDKAIDYDIFQSFNEDKEAFAEDLAYLTDLRQIGRIEPKIFSQVGFDELQGEWGKVMAGRGYGVVVVSPWKLGFATVIGAGS